MNACMSYKEYHNLKELVFQKELTLMNQTSQKNIWHVIIGILNILIINLNHMSVINAMIYQ